MGVVKATKKETKITKIVLTLGDKEITLTPDEAKELKRVLEDIYPDPKPSSPAWIPYDEPNRNIHPYRPMWPGSPTTTYCSAGTSCLLHNTNLLTKETDDAKH